MASVKQSSRKRKPKILRPDYAGERDEILRLHIERCFEETLKIKPCCGVAPKPMFRGCYERFFVCPKCGRTSGMYRHTYEAIQYWNYMMEEA
jgi:hypothetical protein